MSWQAQIITGGPLWSAVEAYAAERKAELTAICTARSASDRDIRDAQAGLEELDRLLDQPKLLKQRARGHTGQPREGY